MSGRYPPFSGQDAPESVPGRRRGWTMYPSVEGDAPRVAAPPSLATLAAATLVPSLTSVEELLAEIRKKPAARLETEARIAMGGMGAIEVAVDRALDRRVAVKTLHAHLRSSASTVARFLREARLMGLLEHPHIVPVYDVGERDDGALYFTMKLIEGQTLAESVASRPRDTATTRMHLDVVAKVADALGFAHSRGVVHCDVKPANVMVGDFGQVYLMDWGIARLVDPEAPSTEALPAPHMHASGDYAAVIGTPGYMSPEQARGDRAELDARSDVFLLGGLLYEVVSGRPPYRGGDRAETLRLAEAATYANPYGHAAAGRATRELERIVRRAMAPLPIERYPTAEAFRDDVLAASRLFAG